MVAGELAGDSFSGHGALAVHALTRLCRTAQVRIARGSPQIDARVPQVVASSVRIGNAGIPASEAAQLRYLLDLKRVAPSDAAARAELRAVLDAGGTLDALAAAVWDGTKVLQNDA